MSGLTWKNYVVKPTNQSTNSVIDCGLTALSAHICYIVPLKSMFYSEINEKVGNVTHWEHI